MSDDRGRIVVEDETLRAGFTAVPNVILKRTDLSPGAKLCYIMLLTYAWDEGSCYPGQQRLAADMGVTDRSVRTYLRELETARLVISAHRGQGFTNVYTLPKVSPENISGLSRKPRSGQDRKSFPLKKTQPKTQVKTNDQYAASAAAVGTDFERFLDADNR